VVVWSAGGLAMPGQDFKMALGWGCPCNGVQLSLTNETQATINRTGIKAGLGWTVD